jgi:hypothetical protein
MPNNSPTLQRIPSAFDIEMQRPQSNTESIPPKLQQWFSTKVFRTVCFFIFCFVILGTSTSMVFIDNKMSIENYMNVLSSLLFLLSPSPLDLIKSKKKT